MPRFYPGKVVVRSAAAALVLTSALLGGNQCARAEFKVGAQLPEFALKTADGATFSLQRKQYQVVVMDGKNELEPKLLFLHLFQPDCLQCRAQLQVLERIYQDFAKQGVLVVGVAHRGDAKAVLAVAKQLNITFPLVVGTGSDLAKQFAAGDSFAITDKKGQVRFAQVGYGAGDEKVWRQDLERLLAGQSVPEETIARRRFQVGDRLPVIELPSVMTGKPIALTGAGGRLTFRDEEGKTAHPKAAIGFFSRY